MAQDISILIDQIMNDASPQRLQLPPLPEVMIHIQEAVDDDRKGLPYMARLIQADPGLCAHLIKIANSPCITMALCCQISAARLHYRIQQLWQHSCRVAAISQVLAGTPAGSIFTGRFIA